MHLTYIHEVELPGMAANTVHVAKMCSAFARNGVEVLLITPGTLPVDPVRREQTSRYYGLSPAVELRHALKLKVPGGPRLFAKLAVRYAKGRRTDLVYSRHVRSCLSAARQGLPTVFEAHAALDDFSPSRRAAFLSLISQPTFQRLVVVSNALRDAFLDDLPMLDGKVVVAHDGADDPYATGEPQDEPKKGAVPNRFSIGYVGHLYPGKCMEIIAPLAPLCPWADFHIVGGAAGEVEHWRRILSSCTNVRFLGHRPHVEVSTHIRRFDIVLAPYDRWVQGRRKGLDIARWMSPLKIFEYMAHGKAIVSSDLPVLREVLADGRTALLCDPGDIAMWVSALERLRDDASLRHHLGRQARDTFRSSYSWARRAERVLDGVLPKRRHNGMKEAPLSADAAPSPRTRCDVAGI